MILKDYHIHSNFCDGEDAPEEIVQAAIEKGMGEIGILTHSYTFFDESYCIKRERICEFQTELKRLKEKYKDKINVLCGVEQDFYSDASTQGFDYVIGSVHYLKAGDEYLSVDESPEILNRITEKYFDGDFYALTQAYYQTVARVAEKIRPDMIGHFDLITKFNKDGVLFCENDRRYIESRRRAVDKLLSYAIPFEINTGAMSRGYKTTPYPSPDIQQYIQQKGGRFVLSSDSHDKQHLCYAFKQYADLSAC